jgi:hypothetical protein
MTGLEAMMEAVRRGILSVDEKGRVWKLKSRTGRVERRLAEPIRIDSTKVGVGYPMVHVWLDGKQYMAAAHRLVYSLTVGPIPPGMEINHIDGVKSNNHPSNLEIATRGQNIRHAIETGLRTYTDLVADKSAPAKALRAQGLSFSKIAKALGVSQTTAFKAVNA